VEAMLDFPEDEIDAPDVTQRNTRLAALRAELDKILSMAQQGSLLREGAHIVLVGQPNVGKSSLLNRLSGEDVALVSDTPGTTRDLIRQSIQIEGVPLHIIDTAGLRDASDSVEQMGIERTYGALKKADAVLILLDASHGLTEDDQEILDNLPLGIPRLHVFNKVDLVAQPAYIKEHSDECHIYLSAKTGEGIDLLRDKLLSLLGWHQEAGICMARERHILALLDACDHLQRAAGEINRPELCAEELRLAQEGLNSITGEFSADDLLGEIFSRFCIGK
ncbi:MAG: GTP-binding protein, partial [Candidatus Nitrotoga sp.]